MSHVEDVYDFSLHADEVEVDVQVVVPEQWDGGHHIRVLVDGMKPIPAISDRLGCIKIPGGFQMWPQTCVSIESGRLVAYDIRSIGLESARVIWSDGPWEERAGGKGGQAGVGEGSDGGWMQIGLGGKGRWWSCAGWVVRKVPLVKRRASHE